MGGCIWFIVMLFFFLIFGWDQLLFMAVYLILIGVFYWWRSKKVDPVPKWELGVAIVCSGLLTLGIFMGFSEYKQYSERKAQEEWLKNRANDRYNVESRSETVEPIEQKPSPSYETGSKATSNNSYDFDEEDYYEEELGFDEGYEDGYQDGRWRSPGFSKRSYDYDYEEGYAQGYYEAAHDEPDYKEGEEYDW